MSFLERAKSAFQSTKQAASSVSASVNKQLDDRNFKLETEAYEKCRKTIRDYESKNNVSSPFCPKSGTYGGKSKKSKKGSKKKSKKKSSKKKGGKR